MSFGDITEGFGKKKKEDKKKGIRSKLNKRSGEGRSTGGGNGTVGFSALGGSAPGTGGGTGTVDTSLFASKADLAALTAAAATRQELAAEKALQEAKDAAQDAAAVAEEAKDTTEEATTDTEQATQDARITAATASIDTIGTTVQAQGAAIAALQASSSSGGVDTVTAGDTMGGLITVNPTQGAVEIDSQLLRHDGTDRVSVYNDSGVSRVEFIGSATRGIVRVKGGTSSGGELRLQEKSTEGGMEIIQKAPDALDASYTQVLPTGPTPIKKRGVLTSYGTGNQHATEYWDSGMAERLPPAFNIPKGQVLNPSLAAEHNALTMTVGAPSPLSPQTLKFETKTPLRFIEAFPRGKESGRIAINCESAGERYRLGAELRATVANGSTGKLYMGAVFFDSQERPVNYEHSQYIEASLTTLAAPLNDGDTTMTVANASGWEPATALSRRVAIADWTDETGHFWGPRGYTRTTGGWGTAINGNVITLNAPWSGGNFPVGKAVRQVDNGGGSYQYMGWVGQNYTEAATWVYKEGRMGHSTEFDSTNQGNMGQRIRSGACSMQFSAFLLLNGGQPFSQMTLEVGAVEFARIDDNEISFLDNLADVDLAGRSAGDTLTWDGTKWKPFMPAPAKVYAEGVGPVGGATSHDVATFTVPITGVYRCTFYGEGYQIDTSIQVRKDPSIRTAANGGGTAALSKRIATRIGGMSNGIIALATARGRATLTAGVTYYFHLQHVNEYSDQNCEWSLEMERVI